MSIIAVGYEIPLASVGPLMVKAGLDWKKGGYSVTERDTYMMGMGFGAASKEPSNHIHSDTWLEDWFGLRGAGTPIVIRPLKIWIRAGVVVLEFKESFMDKTYRGIVFRTTKATPEYLSRRQVLDDLDDPVKCKKLYTPIDFKRDAAIEVKAYLFKQEPPQDADAAAGAAAADGADETLDMADAEGDEAAEAETQAATGVAAETVE